MRVNLNKGLFTKIVLAVSLLLGVVTFAGTTAQAQGWRGHGRVVVRPRVFVYPRTFFPRAYWYGRPYYSQSYYFTNNRVTEDQGYREGLHDGRDDAKHNKGYDPYRHSDYKNAITSAFTEGYLRGYAEGYRERIS